MKRKTIYTLLIVWCWLLLVLGAVALGLYQGWFPIARPEPTVPTTVPVTTAAPTTEPTQPTTTQPPTQPVTEPPTEPEETEPEPQEIVYTLTFAGDCTLGTMYEYFYASGCFPQRVGDVFGYPFANVQPWFATDDFTMVNLEGPLTNEGTPAEKTFAFRGDPKHVKVLTEGSVECVSLANNHSMDFGAVGYENTVRSLEEVGVAYAGDEEICFVETERGLKIGVLAVAFGIDPDTMAQRIGELRQQGAEIVIASFHWGEQGTYHPTYDQQWYAYTAIDHGADIVFGHHPHVLQAVEEYNGGIIYYSLGNFSFGGNDNPRDYDTAMISQQVIRDIDGTVRLGKFTPIPCSISSVSYPNNFQPTPIEEGSDWYQRVLDKISGVFAGPDLNIPTDEPTEPTEETQPSDETTQPVETVDPTETTQPTENTESEPSEEPTEPPQTGDLSE